MAINDPFIDLEYMVSKGDQTIKFTPATQTVGDGWKPFQLSGTFTQLLRLSTTLKYFFINTPLNFGGKYAFFHHCIYLMIILI